MGKPAARVGDMHVCPMFDGPKPHVGGPVMPPGVLTVLIGGIPAATVGCMCVCVGPPDSIVQGSMSVLIGGRPAARLGDSTAHGGKIVVGCLTVLIGDAMSKFIPALIFEKAEASFEQKKKSQNTNQENISSPKLQASGPGKLEKSVWENEDVTYYNVSENDFNKEVLPAIEEADKMMDKKIKQLETWDKAAQDCFKKGFGDHGKNAEIEKNKKIEQMKKMKKLFKELKESKGSKFKFGTIYNTSDKKEVKDTFAWVNKEDKSHTVKLGEAYNNASLTGEDSKAGTLIHELSHFSDVADTHDVYAVDEHGKIKYDGDNKPIRAYGKEEAKNLADKAPDQAVKNADNFEFFVEGTFGC